LVEYLDLADYLLIAEEVLGVPAETIADWPGVGLAESALSAPAMGFGGAEFYPTWSTGGSALRPSGAITRCRTGTSASRISLSSPLDLIYPERYTGRV
jgi:hypothetical protein